MLILEGRAYLKGGLEECAIGIEDGKIVAIKKSLKGDRKVDYGELLLLPGGIDVHVHFRDPGMTHKEDFQSGSTSAAMGGITTVFDMPNTIPPTTTLRDYEAKMRIVKGKAFVDFCLYAGLARPLQVPRLAKAEAPFKLYLAQTTGGLDVAIDEVPELLEAVPTEYPPIVVHAEDPAKFNSTMAGNLAQHNLSRPIEAEVSAVKMLREMNRRFHITHVTSDGGLKSLESSGFTTDVTPHHLLLDCSSQLGQLGKVNPPLRETSEREQIWKAFTEGRIDMLVSDHAPHTDDEKSVNFEDAPAGMPGVETMVPLLLRRVRSGELSIERLIDAVCERPAALMGLNKGKLEVGMDADIVVLNLRPVSRIRGKHLHSKCGWTAFEGWEAVFPAATYLRGNLVVDKGEVVEDSLGKPVKVRSQAEPSEATKKHVRPR